MIVGLGNPGKNYELTRHNVGFMVLDQLAKENCVSFKKERYNCESATYLRGDDKVILIKPMEYMNLSGQSISKISKYYKINTSDILIIHDDMDIPFGTYKIKPKGNSGGHNGIKSVIENLGNNEFKRVKIGIGNKSSIEAKDYVLGKFSEIERKELDNVVNRVCEIACLFPDIDFNLLMNKYN